MQVEIGRVTMKAVQLRNSESPDARGWAWIPRTALTKDHDYSYKEVMIAYRLSPWMTARLTTEQKRALGMLS
jgi:hypothetical protein